jgi:UDP-2,4-diacetamido-2,4,6-trideoxy-beta-L-altropyranose hydrolase
LNSGESIISLRPATLDDQDMVFRWRNDPFILTHGSSCREVNQEEHQRWFAETVVGHRRKMFIVLKHANPIGQVRFDRENQQDCVISVYLLREFTGRGWGVQAIRMGCASVFHVWNVERVIACVRLDNHAGRLAFLKAGFRETESVGICPVGHYSLILSRRSCPD